MKINGGKTVLLYIVSGFTVCGIYIVPKWRNTQHTHTSVLMWIDPTYVYMYVHVYGTKRHALVRLNGLCLWHTQYLWPKNVMYVHTVLTVYVVYVPHVPHVLHVLYTVYMLSHTPLPSYLILHIGTVPIYIVFYAINLWICIHTYAYVDSCGSIRTIRECMHVLRF